MRKFFTIITFAIYSTILISQSTEGFESVSLPNSWINNGCFTTTNNLCAGLRSCAFNGVGDNIITPLIVSGGSISFDYKRSSNTTAWSLNVSYSSTSSGPWTDLGTISNATASCQNASYGIPNNVYIRFIDQRSTGTNERYIDNVSVEDASLPVEFLKFKVDLLNNKEIDLNFSTSSETNNSHFNVERSADARNFESIGEIKGAGNSSKEISYNFTDEKPLPGINYYRIKQTDYDGQFSYSEIRSVRHKGLSNISVTPRTTEGRLDITTELEDYTIAIYNAAGQEVKRMIGMSLDQSINIETLNAGVYFVKIISRSESETVRIVKI